MTPQQAALAHIVADWRNDDDYARLAGIDRAGLMWEWLRRDPAYRDHALTVRSAPGEAMPVAGDVIAPVDRDAQRWGLLFRRSSRSSGPSRANPLASGDRSRRAVRPSHRRQRRRSKRD